jgi:hypothetical protein
MPTEAMFHVYEASPQRAGARRSSTYDEGSMRARLVRVRGGFPIPSPAQIDELGRIAIRRFLELSPERRLASTWRRHFVAGADQLSYSVPRAARRKCPRRFTKV